MKKILYLAVSLTIGLTGCAALMQPAYQPGPSSNYNPPSNYDPPPPNNPPPPDYNNQQGNYAGNQNYDNSPQTDQVFYDELSPYGTWIDYPDYGYVWVPGDVGNDFMPYATNGYWIYSDYGWTWASNYSWGWAPFHYGRWFYDDSYGWMWLPGHDWAPAWVTWGSYGDYYCWAPLAPRVNINAINTGGGWRPPANAWNVVQRRYMAQTNVNNYIVKTNATVINNITNNVTIINNVTNNYNNQGTAKYNRGPQANDVENATNTRIQPVKVSNNVRPGASQVQNNQFLVYRPTIKQKTQQVGLTAAPRKVGTYQPQNGRSPQNPQQQQVRPDGNQQQYPNQRPNNNQPNQQVKPDANQNQQQYPNQRPNNNQQQQQVKPDANQNQQQYPNQRPNNNQQQQQVKPDANQNQQQYPNQRPNNNQQQQQVKPDMNQNPAQNTNQRPNNNQQDPGQRPNNNQPQQQQVRPDANQNPNQKPNNQVPPQNSKGNMIKNKDAQNAKRKADSLQKVKESQIKAKEVQN